MVGVPCEPDQDCEFSHWAAWSECSATCGGVKSRSRKILTTGYGQGLFCEGPLKQTWPCALGGAGHLLDFQNPAQYMEIQTVTNSNLGGKGPGMSNLPKTLRFGRVAVDASRTIDLVVSTTNGYLPADPQLNGMQGTFGNVNLRADTSADVVFELIDSASGEPAIVEDLVLKFFDLDQSDMETEQWSLDVKDPCEEYYTSVRSKLEVGGKCAGANPITFKKPNIVDPHCSGSILDFDLTQVVYSNLGGKGPDVGQPQQLRFGSVSVFDGEAVDLVIDVDAGGDYEPSNVQANGNFGHFGIISLMPGSSAHFQATLVRTGTNEPVRLPKWNLTFFDLDGPSSTVQERIAVSGAGKWLYPQGTTKLTHSHSQKGTLFASTQINIPEPTDPKQLTQEQADCTVTFYFQDTYRAKFYLSVTQTAPSPTEKGRVGQAFMFTGSWCAPAGSRRLQGLFPTPSPVTVLNPSPSPSPSGPGYDCEAGFARWESGWSEAKKSFCCKTRAKGCPISGRYDCDAGYSTWELDWGNGKKLWCCEKYGRGCGKPTTTPSKLNSQDNFWGLTSTTLRADRRRRSNDFFPNQGAHRRRTYAQVTQQPSHWIRKPASRPVSDCGAPTHPQVAGIGPASLTPWQEKMAVAIRFKGTSRVSLTLHASGGCGHNFLFAGKICVSGKCDPCGDVSHCKFLTWNPWSPCSASCGGGLSNRSRGIIRTPKPVHGDSGGCDGAITWSRSCNTHSCKEDCGTVVDCTWQAWSQWGACSRTCGGERTRSRHVAQHAKCGGRPCTAGSSKEIQNCNDLCHGNLTYCAWDRWGPWSSCSVTCGCGRKSRERRLKRSLVRPTEYQEHFSRYQQLQDEVQVKATRRVQSIVTSFAAGSLSLLVIFMVARSCSRAKGPRSSAWRRRDMEADVVAPLAASISMNAE